MINRLNQETEPLQQLAPKGAPHYALVLPASFLPPGRPPAFRPSDPDLYWGHQWGSLVDFILASVGLPVGA